MKKTAAAILSLLLMTSAVAGMADGAYTPGTYRQSAKGMGGDVVVDVTFDADAMTAIDVVSPFVIQTTQIVNFRLGLDRAELRAADQRVVGQVGIPIKPNGLIARRDAEI